jgi:regulation of enolase protein 1 (concanavalin A-like superfamily)
MLHVGDALWVKAGLEMDDGVAWAGCVVTNPYSDWYVSRNFSGVFTQLISSEKVKAARLPNAFKALHHFSPWYRPQGLHRYRHDPP